VVDRRTVVALFALALAGIAGVRASLGSALALRVSWPGEADTLLVPPSGVLRFLSLGHGEMAADLVAARANVYFGSQVASHGEQRSLARALNAAVDLDPGFQRLYLRGASMLVYTGRDFTVEALLAANALLERGCAQFPGDWELPFQMGFNLLFELPKLVGKDDPRAADWRQRGVEALRQSTLLDGAPPWLPGLAARMLTKDGGDELAVRHLERIFEVTNSPETRAEISRRLAGLRGRRMADELAEGSAAIQRAVSSRYPYAPESFSLILGPRVAPGIDLQALFRRDSLGSPTPPTSAPESSP
jgi:hypothetical protein